MGIYSTITILDTAELISRYSQEAYALSINDIILVNGEEIPEDIDLITVDDVAFDGVNATLLRGLHTETEEQADSYTWDEMYGTGTTGMSGYRMAW